MKKLTAIFISILLILTSASIPIAATTQELSENIVILYTNDVHTYINGPLSYDVIAAIKKDLQKQYKYVYLADAGDHIQGTAYGSMDKGESVIKMMNTAQYDVATLGNHEFDYNMEGTLNVIESAEFPYVSANFYREKDGIRGENVLDSYVMFDCGEEKLAFIGITTPETFTKSTPAYFQDTNGKFIYGISGGADGTLLQQDVQKAIDTAKDKGATKVIALGHLGIDESSKPWTSIETISGVCGLDAFIDGHSHSTEEGEIVKDKDGHDVLLTQTGEYFDRIGMMVIDSDTDEITTDFIECEEILADDGETVTGYKLASDLYSGTEIVSDSAVKEIKDAWLNEIDEKLGEKIGSTEIVFDNYDTDKNRLVRTQETNSGDFAADALYYLFDNMGMDVDVAIMNGGGIRNEAITGDITYKICKDMHPFGNVACLQTITGQQLLDALEWGARKLGSGENGGFLQVSGITYKVDTTIPNTITEGEMETWLKGPDNYRVYDVMVYNKETDAYEKIDLEAKYDIAGYNYTLRDLGDGYKVFDGAVNVLDYVMEDYMVLANYVQGFDGGIVGASNSPLMEKYPGLLVDYSTINGSGRIEIAENNDESGFDDEVWVGGIKVTDENKDDILGDGGSVKYNHITDTLTLTDATIINESGHGIYAYGINLTINGIDTDAEGNNSISGKSTSVNGIDEEGYEYTETNPGCGIYVEGDGYGENGGIIINGVIGNISGEEGSGISAYEDITVSGTVGNITCTGSIDSGIESDFGCVIIKEDALLGNITSEGYNGIEASKDIIISGKTGRIFGGGYSGIHATSGDVFVSGTVESISGYASGIEAYSSVDWDEEGNEFYIGGSVKIGGNVGEISGSVVGIRTDANLNMSGNAQISVTDLEAEATRAISVGAEIILSNDCEIIEPAEYKIASILAETYEDESGSVEVFHNTICDADGNPALMIKCSAFVNTFEDVNVSDWYFGDVKYSVENGLFTGTSETTFAPNTPLTRAMLVTVLYRAEGKPGVSGITSFSDLEKGQYYLDAVCWAQVNGIVNGVSETEFAPNNNITREQIAAIMHRYAQYKGYDVSVGENTNILSYDDFDSISEYAIASIQYAVGSGLMKGKTASTLNPSYNATRAEAAAILHRFIENNK
ncbi:MAG: 5'-nucleotidase C-terminal domain-containing protein [Clostridia bacterium]|nr:5'-nucleotidase C-terminal domain-containing protein [Clostridia bacterium]